MIKSFVIRNTVIFSIVLLMMSIVPIAAYPATYYVATTGDDSNPGSETQPWLTITKAANAMVAGDTVYIKAGTYEEQVIPQNSGSANNYIVYAAYQNDKVTIDGANIPLSPSWESGLIHLEDRNYIKISGLRVINAGPNLNNDGIYVDNCSYITIEKNYTYNTVSSGIGVWSSKNIIIDGNEVELACNDGDNECITVGSTETFEVKNNHVHDSGPGTMGGEGITLKDGSFDGKVYKNHVHHINNRLGIYVDAEDKHTYNIEVYQNIVHDAIGADGFTMASEVGGLLENIDVYNNIAYNNGCSGISVTRNSDFPTQPMKNITITNNTFYNNGSNNCSGATWGGGVLIDNSEATNIIVRNNICSQNLLFQIGVGADVPVGNYTVEYNLIDGYREETDEIYGSNYVEGSPLFVNASSADFHLQANSPAIDKGSSVNAPKDDYDGSSRPQGEGHDIGAFEYGSTAPTPDIKANGSGNAITIGTDDTLSITVNLSAGDNSGVDCDWWVAESAPDSWYYYSLSTSWTSAGSSYTNLFPTYQGSLFDLGAYEVLNTSGLSEGTHTFYFAIDTNMNGSLDFDKLYFDSIVVNVE